MSAQSPDLHHEQPAALVTYGKSKFDIATWIQLIKITRRMMFENSGS